MDKTITDLQLVAQKTILDDPRTKEHGIEVLDDNGAITLEGNVPSRDVHKAAEKIVKDIPGVISVINSLEIRESELGNLV